MDTISNVRNTECSQSELTQFYYEWTHSQMDRISNGHLHPHSFLGAVFVLLG